MRRLTHCRKNCEGKLHHYSKNKSGKKSQMKRTPPLSGIDVEAHYKNEVRKRSLRKIGSSEKRFFTAYVILRFIIKTIIFIQWNNACKYHQRCENS